MPNLTHLFLVPLLIAMNAFFVAAEYALVAIRNPQIEALAAAGWGRTARAMSRLKQNPASAIGAIQVCITMTNLLLGWIGEPAMSALLEHLFGGLLAGVLPANVFTAISFGLSFIIVTLLTVVFSELLPKALTLRYTPTCAKLTAVTVLGIMRGTAPLVWLMNAMANLVTRPLGLGSVDQMEREYHTAEEIRRIAADAAEAGALTPRERSLILNSLSLGRRTAEQIMVPRVRVVYLDQRRSMEENLRVMGDTLFSRLPLCDGGMDHVVGYVYTKEILTAWQEQVLDSTILNLLAKPAVFAPVSVPLEKLLTLFHDSRTHLVFLVDEHGGVEGIVTVTDVVDELLGEIAEASGVSSTTETRATIERAQAASASAASSSAAAAPETPPTPLVLPGSTPLHELPAQFRVADLAHFRGVHTLGGLITAQLGHIPYAGESVELDGLKFRVLESDGRSVGTVEIIPRSAPPADPD